jgi:hypothetical protein
MIIIIIIIIIICSVRFCCQRGGEISGHICSPSCPSWSYPAGLCRPCVRASFPVNTSDPNLFAVLAVICYISSLPFMM